MRFELTNRSVLILVLTVGTVLRFWNFTSIPFSHDEFSALFRLDYASLNELITNGVRPDGHPAGVQVFLYYWTSLFGKVEWVVKLPFAIAGVLSIWLVYKLGSLWFNATVGLLSASLLATLQYPIVYSVTARPYISGLFLSLVLVWFWSQLLFKNKWRLYNMLGLAVSLAMCAYNHHFSLLFAAIVAITGLFYLHRNRRSQYIIICVVAILLYLPHLSIFFEQLKRGGIEGWLAKPEFNWVITYLRYIFHYSWVFISYIILLIIVGVIHRRRLSSHKKKYITLAFWFLTPFLIGFIYSVQVNAVLQYSVLIFSFPYLLFLLFGHFKLLKPRYNFYLVTLTMLVSIFTLKYERRHFNLLYESNYERIVSDIETASELGLSRFLVSSNQRISEYYLNKRGLQKKYTSIDSFKNLGHFKKYIEATSLVEDTIYLGGWSSMNPNYLSIILEYYPDIIRQNNYLGGTTYVLGKGSINGELLVDEVSGPFTLASSQEWSASLEVDLCEVMKHKNDALVLSVEVQGLEYDGDISLVSVVQTGEEIIHWSDMKLSNDVIDSNSSWQKIYHTISFANISLKRGARLKTFVWKQIPKSLTMRNLEIKYQKGNEVVYGLRDEF